MSPLLSRIAVIVAGLPLVIFAAYYGGWWLLALDDTGIWAIEPGALDAQPIVDPLDPLTPVHRVDDLPRGTPLAGAEEAVRWRLAGAALVAAALSVRAYVTGV